MHSLEREEYDQEAQRHVETVNTFKWLSPDSINFVMVGIIFLDNEKIFRGVGNNGFIT